MSLEQAIRHARKNPIKAKGRTSISRFGSILTNGLTYFYGWNSYRSHPLQARFADIPERIHIHAEIDAIARAIKGEYRDLSGYTLYVARVLADGTPALARPCPGCLSAIEAFDVGAVEWTK